MSVVQIRNAQTSDVKLLMIIRCNEGYSPKKP